jgi:hypothetical protein
MKKAPYQQLSGMSILSTTAQQVPSTGPGWPDEPIYQMGHGNPEEEVA